jgi:hypothetical protein
MYFFLLLDVNILEDENYFRLKNNYNLSTASKYYIKNLIFFRESDWFMQNYLDHIGHNQEIDASQSKHIK